jgi:hypothetical protein
MIALPFPGANTGLPSVMCGLRCPQDRPDIPGWAGRVAGGPVGDRSLLRTRLSSSSQTEHVSVAMRGDLWIGPAAGWLCRHMSLRTRVLPGGQLINIDWVTG